MTHFTVALIVPRGKLDRIESFIAEQLAPFDEAKTVEPYVFYSVEQAAADKKRLRKIIRHKKVGYNLVRCQCLLQELNDTTPDQQYRKHLKYHELFNDRLEPLSTYNPKSKWDWYVIGGRWDGWINDKETAGEREADNLATTEEAIARNKVPHAIITPDGEWHEHGKMGWWAVLLTENENWDEEARDIFGRYPGHHVVIVDAHI